MWAQNGSKLREARGSPYCSSRIASKAPQHAKPTVTVVLAPPRSTRFNTTNKPVERCRKDFPSWEVQPHVPTEAGASLDLNRSIIQVRTSFWQDFIQICNIGVHQEASGINWVLLCLPGCCQGTPFARKSSCACEFYDNTGSEVAKDKST